PALPFEQLAHQVAVAHRGHVETGVQVAPLDLVVVAGPLGAQGVVVLGADLVGGEGKYHPVGHACLPGVLDEVDGVAVPGLGGAAMEQAHVEPRLEAAVDGRHVAAQVDVDGEAHVLGLGGDAGGLGHDGGHRLVAAGAHHGDGFGGGVHGHHVIVGDGIPQQVGVEKIRV